MSLVLRRFFFSSLSLWFLITLFGIYFLAHIGSFINFGIDLVGGTFITLEVKVDKAYSAEVLERVETALRDLKAQGASLPIARDEVVAGSAHMAFADDVAAYAAQTAFTTVGLHTQQSGKNLTVSLSEREKDAIKSEAVQANINVLRTRLDQFGAGEIAIAAQGDRHIFIELPNVNPQEAKARIGKAALLEIKPVEDAAYSRDALLATYGGKVPSGMMVVQSQVRRGSSEFYLVPSYTDLTGRLLKSANVNYGGDLGVQPLVEFEFKPEGGTKFELLTRKYRGERIAVIIDNVVISAPVVQDVISTRGIISGDFTTQSASELALLLKSGAFAAPVSFEEERHIEPTLGVEMVHKGLMSCIIGLVLLFFFSVLLYKVAGVFAFIVLLYNLLLILFGLSAIGATLTLSGIAGMILTIGMAIDSSILIYERMREELAQGVPLAKAVDAGFAGSFWVIWDANFTNLLVAIVLYKLGAGPLQGFAITLIIGIIATLVTGLVLLKSIFKFVISAFPVRTIKI